jgi:hypothetical protein
MSDSNNSHTPIIVGLILAMVFLIAAPVTFYLIKRGDRQPPVVAQPNVIVTPPQQVAPPIIVAPVVPPAPPPSITVNLYNLGWADARLGRGPDPRYCQDPSYQAGYRDFCTRYRPGFKFDFRINVGPGPHHHHHHHHR